MIGLIGASGETGSSILHGLQEEGYKHIVVFTRPESAGQERRQLALGSEPCLAVCVKGLAADIPVLQVDKPANQALRAQGIEVRPFNAKGDHASLVSALNNIDVLISAVGGTAQLDRIPMATAAKEAGVKRFVPCAFLCVMPAGGIHLARDEKEQVYLHIKKLYLPYTIIDVGWWYQLSFPRLPSGKIDYAISIPDYEIVGGGDQLSGITHLDDIGRYVARIVSDERTLNKAVFVYDELWSQNQIATLLEKLSGEKPNTPHVSAEVLQARVVDADEKMGPKGLDISTLQGLTIALQKGNSQYKTSWGIRGDNTPEYAKYLGYLDGKELYPDFKHVSFESYLQEVVDGHAKGIYSEMKARLAQNDGASRFL